MSNELAPPLHGSSIDKAATEPELPAGNLLIARLVSLLVQGRYRDIEWVCNGVRLDAAALQSTVQSYGRTLIEPPRGALLPDWVHVIGTSPPEWTVNVPLFTAEEGRCRLTLCLRFKPDGWSRHRIEIDDLRVL